jgi:hypothetical protein
LGGTKTGHHDREPPLQILKRWQIFIADNSDYYKMVKLMTKNKSYEKPMMEKCGSIEEKTESTFCRCSNPISIPGLPGKWCDIDDCIPE